MSKELADRLDKIKECLDFFCRRCNEQGFYSPPLQPIVKEAYEAIAALRAEPVAWMPMDTAPKGGGAIYTTDPKWVQPPRILIRFGSEAVSVAYWDWYYAEGGSGFTDGFAWVEPCSGECLNLHYSTPPDGWTPLPAAPSRETDQRENSNPAPTSGQSKTGLTESHSGAPTQAEPALSAEDTFTAEQIKDAMRRLEDEGHMGLSEELTICNMALSSLTTNSDLQRWQDELINARKDAMTARDEGIEAAAKHFESLPHQEWWNPQIVDTIRALKGGK